MSLVAALLYELVEEPGREAVLALWRRRSCALPRARRPWARAGALAILLGALGAQHAVASLASLPPVEEARLRRVLGADSPHVLEATTSPPAAEGRPARVRLPASWRRGPVGDLRAPRSLLVFVEGAPLPFTGTQPFEGPPTTAYYVHGRSDHLNLPIASAAAVTVVHWAPSVALALTWSRLADEPVRHFGPLLLLGAMGLAIGLAGRPRVWTPRITLSLAIGLVTAWLVSGAHLQPWAPVVLALELAAVIGLVVAGREAAEPEPLRARPLSARPGSA
jgi:hypothetical protein